MHSNAFQAKNLLIEVDYKKHRMIMIKTMAAFLAFFCFINLVIPVILVTNNIDGIVNWVISPSYAFMLLLMCLFTLQFAFAGLALSVRLRMLNQCLRQVSIEWQIFISNLRLKIFFLRLSFSYKIDNISIAGLRNVNFKAFTRIFQNLHDGIELLNSTFTFQMIAIIINTLIIKTFAAYGIVYEILSNSKRLKFVLLQDAAWLIMQYLLQMLVCYVGSSVTMNVNATEVIISKLLNDLELNDELVNKLQNFLTRINHRTLDVGNDLFTINWKLLVAVSQTFELMKTVKSQK